MEDAAVGSLLGIMVYEQLSTGPPWGPEQVTAVLGREKDEGRSVPLIGRKRGDEKERLPFS